MLHLSMCGLAICTMGMNMLLEFLAINGNTTACVVGGASTVLLIILNKFTVFVYFVETIHALRACTKCRHESCSWLNRWPHDYIWSCLTIALAGGSIAVAIHAAADYGKGVLVDHDFCVIAQSVAVTDHVLIWHTAFYLMLFSSLVGISLCTMKNFPKLHDVTACQYWIRSLVTKVVPLRPGAAEEPIGSSIAVVCPAYLVPLNQRSAGRCECSALKAMATLSLTTIPTLINLGILAGFQGSEPSWLMYLLCEFDGEKSFHQYDVSKTK
jgi:hypothetical protein